MTFETFWTSYAHPENRGDKLRAAKRFERIVKSGAGPELLAAMEEYRTYQKLNQWYHPLQMATFLGSEDSERWRNFMPEKMKDDWRSAFSPLLAASEKEERLKERAEGIQREMQNRQKWWDMDSARHFHSDRCQTTGCQYEPAKRPAVREIDVILAQIRSESL